MGIRAHSPAPHVEPLAADLDAIRAESAMPRSCAVAASAATGPLAAAFRTALRCGTRNFAHSRRDPPRADGAATGFRRGSPLSLGWLHFPPSRGCYSD